MVVVASVSLSAMLQKTKVESWRDSLVEQELDTMNGAWPAGFLFSSCGLTSKVTRRPACCLKPDLLASRLV